MIEESLDVYDTDEEKLAYIDIVTSLEGLKETCEEAIERQLDTTGYNAFMHALMNTIDWQELLDDVTNDMEGEKDMIEEEEYSFKKFLIASLPESVKNLHEWVKNNRNLPDIEEWLRDRIDDTYYGGGEDCDGDAYLESISTLDALKADCRKRFFEGWLSIDNPKAVDYLMKTVAWYKLRDDLASKIERADG